MTQAHRRDYEDMKRRLFWGTLLVDLLVLGIAIWLYPEGFLLLASGMAMGFFNLWSLSFSTEHPKHRIQFVFSLIRICILAYILVTLSHARVVELSLAIGGFLSYKLVLYAEYFIQATVSFRRSGVKAEPR